MYKGGWWKAGDMAQLLRALAGFAEDLGWVPSTTSDSSQPPGIPRLLVSVRIVHMCYT